MKCVLARMSILIGCMCLAFASASSWAQHASPGAHPASSASPPAGLADAKVEFENEAIIVMRVRMAPHEKTPMHDITSARLVVWLTDAHLRDTHPDGSANETHRRPGKSTGSARNDTRERISRTNRWNFWRSCPRHAERLHRDSLGAN